MLRIPIFTVCGALLAAALPQSITAATTNEVDISALAAKAGEGAAEAVVDGWRFRGLKTYSGECLKFDTLGDILISADYARPIVALLYSVRCSSLVPTKTLSVLTGEGGARIGSLPNVSSKDRLEAGVFPIPEEAGVRRVSLFIDGSGTAGVWGVGRLAVVTADDVETPQGLRVTRTGSSRAVFSWTNNFSTVSNVVSLTRLSMEREGEETLFFCDFSDFSAGGNPRDYTDALPTLYPGLSGVRIYAPKGSSGICQISNGDMHGALEIDAPADGYSDVVLHIRLKRYPGDHAETEVRWTDGSRTNSIASVSLSDEFSDEEIDVSSVPRGASLLVCEDSAKGDRRVLVDSLSLVRTGDYRELGTEERTAVRGSGRVDASTAGLRFTCLEPSSRYRVSVRSYNASGVRSDEAEAEFTTEDARPSVIYLR